MSDLTIDLDVRYIAQAARELNGVATAMARLGGGGGGAGGGGGGGGAFGSVGPIGSPFPNIGASLMRAAEGVGALTIAIGALIKATSDGVQALRGFATAQFGGGGSIGDTYGLSIMGRALGMDPLGLAYRLRAASLSGGTAMGQMAAFGYPIQPTDVGSPLDSAGAAMAFLRRASQASLQEQRSLLSPVGGIGMPGLGPYLQVFGRHPELLDDLERVTKDIYSPEHLDSAVRFNLEMAKLGQSFDDLKAALAADILPGLTKATQAATWTAKNVVPDAMGLAGAFAAGGPAGAMAWIARKSAQHFTGGGGDQAQKALNSNTQALQELNNTLRYVHGIHGGGELARSALPRAWGGYHGPGIQNAFDHGSRRLGAYAVGM